MSRVFITWLETFKDSISDYSYYTDFEKIYQNTQKVKVELNILNSLIGSENIEQEFIALLEEYPKVLKCIPLLLAVRKKELYAGEKYQEIFLFNFKKQNHSIEKYCMFMKKTGLFELLQNHIIRDLVDYVTGIETGLDSNARKNRGGKLMEDLLEYHIQKTGFIKGKNYFKEMKTKEIEKHFLLDLSAISHSGKTVKKFDFVFYKNNTVYAVETNFYTGGGSKLNEVARSYKTIALEAKNISNFEFVWVTDGKKGWEKARNNLKETFDVMSHVYNINDLENDILLSI